MQAAHPSTHALRALCDEGAFESGPDDVPHAHVRAAWEGGCELGGDGPDEGAETDGGEAWAWMGEEGEGGVGWPLGVGLRVVACKEGEKGCFA